MVENGGLKLQPQLLTFPFGGDPHFPSVPSYAIEAVLLHPHSILRETEVDRGNGLCSKRVACIMLSTRSLTHLLLTITALQVWLVDQQQHH